MNTTRIPKTTKFPVRGFGQGPIPSRALDAETIAQRQQDCRGATVFKNQRLGVFIVSSLTDPKERQTLELTNVFIATLACAGLGSAWHHLKKPFRTKEAPVQGRTVYTPDLYQNGAVAKPQDTLDKSHGLMTVMAPAASCAIHELSEGVVSCKTNRELGKGLAAASLTIWAANLAQARRASGDVLTTELGIQTAVKIHSDRAFDHCRQLTAELGGELPTLAGLADERSNLSHWVHNNPAISVRELCALNDLRQSEAALRQATAR